MFDVGAAILIAQPVIGGSGIEDHGGFACEGIGKLQECVGCHIGDDEADAAIHLGNHRRDQCRRILVINPLKFEFLLQELARRIVIVDGEQGAADTIVLGGWSSRDKGGSLSCSSRASRIGIVLRPAFCAVLASAVGAATVALPAGGDDCACACPAKAATSNAAPNATSAKYSCFGRDVATAVPVLPIR